MAEIPLQGEIQIVDRGVQKDPDKDIWVYESEITQMAGSRMLTYSSRVSKDLVDKAEGPFVKQSIRHAVDDNAMRIVRGIVELMI